MHRVLFLPPLFGIGVVRFRACDVLLQDMYCDHKCITNDDDDDGVGDEVGFHLNSNLNINIH